MIGDMTVFRPLQVCTFPHPIPLPGVAAKISPKLVQVILVAGNKILVFLPKMKS